MVPKQPEDILLPMTPGASDQRPGHSRIVAFVPITIAIIGVAAILVGQVTVREFAASDVLSGVDPITTGAIQTSSPSGIVDRVGRP